MHDWTHSPLHRVQQAGTYMVTAGTYLKQPFFRGAARLDYFCKELVKLAGAYLWDLQAWAVFPNHYHFVAVSPSLRPDVQPPHRKAGGAAGTIGEPLAQFIRHLHSVTSIQVNRWDEAPGRRTWFQYRDTRLTLQKSYLARLSYVHRNAVHHGLVPVPSAYPWCSAAWFEGQAPTSFYKTVMGLKVDRVNAPDEYPVLPADL